MKEKKYLIASLSLFIAIIFFVYKPLTSEVVKEELPSITITDRLLQEGLTLHKIGLFNESKEKLENAIIRQPRFALSYYYLAEVYRKQGLIDDAIREYLHIIRIDPEAYNSRCILSELLFAREQKDKAVFLLKEAININPYGKEAYEKLIFIYREEGMIQQAEKLMENFKKGYCEK
ncbi:hypothetical protein KAW18_10390 [candidate division WOR-3 bacterium]|nr:hypothetical protein [candidate division WOR-3 bacterium]